MTPSVYTIPPDQPFADALVAGLLREFGDDRMVLARGMVIAPNNRAVLAIRDAFVRAAEPALLLPRLVTIGDSELDESAGLALEASDSEPLPPAIEALHRRMILARLIDAHGGFTPGPVDAAMAFRLAGELAQVLDALTIERKSLRDLAAVDLEEASDHWKVSASALERLGTAYQLELGKLGLIDLTDRRNRVLTKTAEHWAKTPPPGFVVAAGISTAAPAIAALLATISRMPQGRVVLAGFDPALGKDEWVAVRGTEEAPAEQAHPQFHLTLLLDRMNIGLGEVRHWPASHPPTRRSKLVAEAMTPARFTSDWYKKGKAKPLLEGVSVHRFGGPADEAQGIAIAMRAALEVPEKTVALVTPDRTLAARVAGHLKRWGIAADDSAGKPLGTTLAGGLMQAMAAAVADQFAPAALLALLKHPLVMAGDDRRKWVDGARWLDTALRGARPASGLSGITARLDGRDAREIKAFALARDWWRDHGALLQPLEQACTGDFLDPMTTFAAFRDAAEKLCGDAVWAGQEGRAVSELVERFEALADQGPQKIARAAWPDLVRTLLDSVTVRPAWGGHHRLFIRGLLEARLQSAELIILGGLNEGNWPGLSSPDPFLPPRMRRALGLPGLDFRIGLSAHDFTLALGAKEVIITRSKRDATAPTIESRFLLRLSARAQPEQTGLDLPSLSAAIDVSEQPVARAIQPAPCPPADERPRELSISGADKLVQDPYGYYAQSILKLQPLDPLEADMGPRERGTLIHAALERWGNEDRFAPGRLLLRFDDVCSAREIDPADRAFDLPRLREALHWAERAVVRGMNEGRRPVFWEEKGSIDHGGIKITGKPDRVDRLDDGTLAVVDYKTGDNPKKKQVKAGFALQLGLLGHMAEAGAFKNVEGAASRFEYWRLNKKDEAFGRAEAMDMGKDDHRTLAQSAIEFLDKAIAAYLLGDAPFTARLHPDYSQYSDYDHLMRLEEWYGPQG